MSKKASGSRSLRAGKAAKQKPRKSPKAKARKPTPRQSNLIEGIVSGQSVRSAALAAGYSVHTANHPDELLGAEAVRTTLANLIAPVEHLASRINEGVDATYSTALVLGRKGKETIETVQQIAWMERRKYVELAMRVKGIVGNSSDLPLAGMQPRRVIVEYVRVDEQTTA
jgi:hypothetical protein